jgi:lipopolysaccharide/colanic/teichoic acid biosynthesis glycosyltransferase
MINSKTLDILPESLVLDFSTYDRSKRLMDLLGSLAALIVLFPLFILIMLAIKASAPGQPALYRQLRTGKNGSLFLMWKFRTMIPGADRQWQDLQPLNQIKGKMFKNRRDPRITRLGRLLRRSSLDELPQLVNVLRGEMSLVGPRPPLPHEVEHYNSHERIRISVTPGCTGLWQVSGRNDLSFYQMVELDLHYIQNRSFRLDLKILFRTIPAVLNRKGAY